LRPSIVAKEQHKRQQAKKDSISTERERERERFSHNQIFKLFEIVRKKRISMKIIKRKKQLAKMLIQIYRLYGKGILRKC
jgi:hypothetical protein